MSGAAHANGPAPANDARRARQALLDAFGPGPAPAVGIAPGRVTLVGEHVDYVGGHVACMAVDLSLEVAARPSRDGRWRVAALGQRVERLRPAMAGDLGDRLLAAALALDRNGITLPPLEMAVTGDLPPSAGLASSAAVILAALLAMLRLTRLRLTGEELVAVALTAERDIAGVPCGDLDQRTIVHAREGAVLALDCGSGSRRSVPWPWPGISLLVAASGESHDVGGRAYRRRREAAEKACSVLGVPTCQQIGERWRELKPGLQPAGRHVATETRRADAAVRALEAGDVAALGRLMDESHESLRRDCAVSTPRLDAMVEATRRVPGCHGARLVGAGFGGSVVALVEEGAAGPCAAALAGVSGMRDATWLLHPAAGLGVTAADVVSP
ncbi:MAG: galactokinase family protein [Candidatus Dormibacteria bacterium]